jgi:hypothetical protein
VRRMTLVALALVVALGAGAAQAAAKPRFSTSPALSPGFSWDASDYVVRCAGNPVTVNVKVSGSWQGKVGSSGYRSSSFTVSRPLSAGKSFTVAFRRSGGGKSRRFYVRCLPDDFPNYVLDVVKPRGPRFFIMQTTGLYAAIIDRYGAPVWWVKATGNPDNAELLPDGRLAWAPVPNPVQQFGDYQIRTLKNKYVRTVKSGNDTATDIHELLQLPNKNWLLAGQYNTGGFNAQPYGGLANATAVGVKIQEITPSGNVVWEWGSNENIGLEETGSAWWPGFILGAGQPYDISHWNSVEPAGKYYFLSFRHLDAVYAISRKTGKVAWKLGGTQTSRSLKVLNDPQASYPFSGQHDARLQPDGTVSIYNNNTQLGIPPRVVRYRLDLKKRTAKLVQSISDPEIKNSICCGSSRLLPNGNWLIDWGGNGRIGVYSPKGKRLFKFETTVGFSYRANEVAPGALTYEQLRRAMNAIYK